MTPMLAIARRELFSVVLSPVGYVVAALFLFFTALVYFAAAPMLVGAGFSAGQPASLHLFFEMAIWVLFLVAPAISMRAVSEEVRLGTLEMLMTAPVRESQVVVGKFIGAMSFLVLLLAPTVLFVVALERFGRPDYGELLCGYLGLLLVGGTCLASGIFASALTGSQMMAYILTVFFWLILLLATMVVPFLAGAAGALAGRPGNSPLLESSLMWMHAVARFFAAGNPISRMRGFVIGLLDSFNVVYFVSFTAVFLAAAARALGMRRWS